jgi:hypothetical protein
MNIALLEASIEQKRALIATLEMQKTELQSLIQQEEKQLENDRYEAGLIPFYKGQKVTILTGYSDWSKENQGKLPIGNVDGKQGIVYSAHHVDYVYIDMPDSTKASWVLSIPPRFLKASEESP